MDLIRILIIAAPVLAIVLLAAYAFRSNHKIAICRVESWAKERGISILSASEKLFDRGPFAVKDPGQLMREGMEKSRRPIFFCTVLQGPQRRNVWIRVPVESDSFSIEHVWEDEMPPQLSNW
jgi:hypothetical protein